MSAPASVLERLCAALNERTVRYLVIGDRALQLQGRRCDTLDVDLLLDPDVENLRRALDALAALGYLSPAAWLATELRDRAVLVVGQEPAVALVLTTATGEFEASARQAPIANLGGVRIRYLTDPVA